MLFTDAFTVNCWRLTIGSKTNDKLSASLARGDRARALARSRRCSQSKMEVKQAEAAEEEGTTRFTVPRRRTLKTRTMMYHTWQLWCSRFTPACRRAPSSRACKSRSCINPRLSRNCISRKGAIPQARLNSDLKQTIKKSGAGGGEKDYFSRGRDALRVDCNRH